MNDGGIKKIISIPMKGWPFIIFALVLSNQTANAQQAKAASKDKLTKRRYIELEVVNMAFDSRGNAIKTLKKSLSGKKRLVLSRLEYFD